MIKTSAVLLFISLVSVAQGLYFHIAETERKCFIEEIPDETTVIGKLSYLLAFVHSYSTSLCFSELQSRAVRSPIRRIHALVARNRNARRSERSRRQTRLVESLQQRRYALQPFAPSEEV